MFKLCISQRRTGSSPLWPPMGPGTFLGVGAPVPLFWWALNPTRSRRKRRRRRPCGGSSSTSSWARVTSITPRGASLSNWACSCSKSSSWLCRWMQLLALIERDGAACLFQSVPVKSSLACLLKPLCSVLCLCSWCCLDWATRWWWRLKRKTRPHSNTSSWRVTRTTLLRPSTRRRSCTAASTLP